MRSAHRNETLRRRLKSRHAPERGASESEELDVEPDAPPPLVPAPPNDRPLTYRVYDLAALEARESARREARRSMIAIKARSPYRGPKRAAVTLVADTWVYLKHRQTPPKVAAVAFGFEVKHALEEARRAGKLRAIAVGIGYAFAAALTLLGALLLFASFTDDARVARPESRAAMTIPISTPTPAPSPPPSSVPKKRVTNEAAEIFIP